MQEAGAKARTKKKIGAFLTLLVVVFPRSKMPEKRHEKGTPISRLPVPISVMTPSPTVPTGARQEVLTNSISGRKVLQCSKVKGICSGQVALAFRSFVLLFLADNRLLRNLQMLLEFRQVLSGFTQLR